MSQLSGYVGYVIFAPRNLLFDPVQTAIWMYWPFEKWLESHLQDLLEAALSKDVDSEIVRNNACARQSLSLVVGLVVVLL